MADAIEKLTQEISHLNEIFRLRNPLLKDMNFAQRLLNLKSNAQSPLEILQIDLATARTDFRYAAAGNIFYVNRIYTTATGVDASGTVQVKFNRTDQLSRISLQASQGYETDFEAFFFTNTAQAGLSAEIYVIQSDNFKIIDNRLSATVASVGTLASITGDIAGLNALPSGATEIFALAGYNGITTDQTLYTNSSGKTIKLLESGIWTTNNTAAVPNLALRIHNGTSFTKEIVACGNNNSYFNGMYKVHLPPIELPNGHTVRFRGYDSAMAASGTATYGSAMIRGYYV